MPPFKIEPDRDHSEKASSYHSNSSPASDVEPTYKFNNGPLPPSSWCPTSSSFHGSGTQPTTKFQHRALQSSTSALESTLQVSQDSHETKKHPAPEFAGPCMVDSTTIPNSQAQGIGPWNATPSGKSAFEPIQTPQYNIEGLRYLRTVGMNPFGSSDSGLPTPNTTPSTGTHRWTPLSSRESASSGLSSQAQPQSRSSPWSGFIPSTYASKSPWINTLGNRQDSKSEHRSSPSLEQGLRNSGMLNGTDMDFGTRTERQLFKPSYNEIRDTGVPHDALVNRPIGFRPMDALLPPAHSHHSNTSTPFNLLQSALHHAYLPSFSSRYCGKHVDSNASADHLLPEQNCALWLTNLPPAITYSQLLGSIRHFGRIWCTYINEANQQEHVTAAAKVVFFKPQAASALLQAAWSCAPVGPLVIQGYHVKVAHNRIKYPEKSYAQGESRVLIITGHPSFVNEKALLSFFEQRFIFQTDRIRVLVQTVNRSVVEFSFGSYRCQSQMGMMALEKDRPLGFEKVEYGEDPCEIGETYSSHRVAMERIHGICL